MEIGRVAETDKTPPATNINSVGDIFKPKGSAYTITSANGLQLNTNTFRLPVRVI
jgi:L-aminopeptidase/D-esterase-like protein